MAYRDELLAARSRLALLERELARRRSEPGRLRELRTRLRDERRRLARPWRGQPPEAAETPEPDLRLPRVEEFFAELGALDGRALEVRARAVEAELAVDDGIARGLAAEVDALSAECRHLRDHPRVSAGPAPWPWPYVAGGLVAAGLAYLLVYSIFVWWLARVSLLGLT